jgi:arsenical pump membrane protein
VATGTVRRAAVRVRPGWALLLAGALAAGVAAAADPGAAGASARQAWPPFVLVAGLLMIGLVAEEDGVFGWLGDRLAGAARSGRSLFVAVVVTVAVVAALLNLDTSVAFLTPVLLYTARRRGTDGGVGTEGAVLLSTCLLVSNAGSLLLPGSNLTNLIVLGHLHLTGGAFLARMGLPWVAAVVVTAAVVAWAAPVGGPGYGPAPVPPGADPGPAHRLVLGPGLVAVLAAAVLVVVLAAPALPVVAVGLAAVAARTLMRRRSLRPVLEVVGLPVLAGLFGLAVGLGAAGRDWSLPARLLSHLDPWSTAAVAAVTSVVVNNLPAASLLSARVPPHPYALLVGLNLGPNLFVTGSLAWVLWLRSARAAGGSPSIGQAVRLGALAVPLSIVAAVGALMITGSGS